MAAAKVAVIRRAEAITQAVEPQTKIMKNPSTPAEGFFAVVPEQQFGAEKTVQITPYFAPQQKTREKAGLRKIAGVAGLH